MKSPQVKDINPGDNDVCEALVNSKTSNMLAPSPKSGFESWDLLPQRLESHSELLRSIIEDYALNREAKRSDAKV